jgi:hypothetical protein
MTFRVGLRFASHTYPTPRFGGGASGTGDTGATGSIGSTGATGGGGGYRPAHSLRGGHGGHDVVGHHTQLGASAGCVSAAGSASGYCNTTL